MTQQLKDRLAKAGLGDWFALFLLFLYGPILVMLVLSFQGANGGATFPAKGLVTGYWYSYLGNAQLSAIRHAAVVSLILALMVGLISSSLSLSLIMAYRRMSRRMGASHRASTRRSSPLAPLPRPARSAPVEPDPRSPG